MTEAETPPNASDGWGAPAGSTSARQPPTPRPASPDYEGAPGYPPAGPTDAGRSSRTSGPQASPNPGGARQRSPGRFERSPDPSRGTSRYGRGPGGDPRAAVRYPRGQEYERRPSGRTPAVPTGFQRAGRGPGLASTSGPIPLGVPGPLAGTPARVERATGNLPGPPPAPLVRPQRKPVRLVAAPAPVRPVKTRRIRLVEKFGGRRLRHHASLWRRIRSLVGILLIGFVIASLIAAVIAVIVGAIALAAQHALR